MSAPGSATDRSGRSASGTDTQVFSPLPERVRMPLLDLVTREALDADYVEAARRRAERQRVGEQEPPAPHGPTRLRGAVVALAVFGLLIVLAALQNAREADVDQESRQALVDRVDTRRAEVASLTDRVRTLRSQIDDLRTSSGRLRSDLAEATVQLRGLQISTGFVAVAGPGVRITVDDDPDRVDTDGLVRASDLRLLVNGLWEAGAEAVAVNGRRLTALSALVNSSIAINVNDQPLSPPYVVTAVGDPDTLQADLLRTTSGVTFQALAEQYGFEVERQNEQRLQLPSAPLVQERLRFATEADPDAAGAGTPSGTPSRDPQEATS